MNTGISATSISSFGECRSNAKHFLSPDQTWCGATHPACTKSASEDSTLGGFEWVSNRRLTGKKCAVLYVYILYTVHAVISHMLVTRMLMGVRKESSQFHWSNRGSCQPLVLKPTLVTRLCWKISISTVKDKESWVQIYNKQEVTNNILSNRELFSGWWKDPQNDAE